MLSYVYDALNRKTAEYAGTTSGSLLASWTYDTVAKGEPASSTIYTGSAPGSPGLAYTESVGGYDAAYQPTSTTLSIPAGAPAFGGTSYTTTSTYNADEQKATRTDPAEGGLGSVTDTDTRLTLIGARDYDPTLGRFTSVDPVFSATSPLQDNGYAYGLNNPVTNTDPSGLCSQSGPSWARVGGCSWQIPESIPSDPDWYTPDSAGAITEELTGYSSSSDNLWDSPGSGGSGSGSGGGSGRSSAFTAQTPAKADVPPGANSTRQWYQSGSYYYHEEQWLGVGLGGYSASEIANVFKDHPSDIFPFAIGGCSKFVTGEQCRLENASPTLWDGSGTVSVATTSTTVKFTVVSNDYFDAPGSTIQFSIVHRSDGYYLDQTAQARGSDILVTMGVGVSGEDFTWQWQAANLRQEVLKYGHKDQ
jgi:RHS repeat-associated protein